MNKLVYLGLSILELSKILIYGLYYDYVKLKYGENVRLGYMGTDSFIVHIKTDDIYKDSPEARFDTSNFDLDRPLPKVKNNKVIGLLKYKLSGKIMKKLARLTTKPYSYLIDDGCEDKKAKDTQKRVIKENLNFKIIKTV